MANKKITLDGLARMIKKGFDGVDENFDSVNKNFKSVNKRFNSVENRLGRLEKNQKIILTKLEDIVYRGEFEELESRVRELERLVLAVKN